MMGNENSNRGKNIWLEGEEPISKYDIRTASRERTLMRATMNLVGFYMLLGDEQSVAESKVGQISRAIRKIDGGAKYDFTLGDTSGLLDAINLVDQTELPFFTNEAKTQLLTDLQST